jgi:hypothetical protein
MKNIRNFAFVLVGLVLATLAFSFAPPGTTSSSKTMIRTYAADTITNAENDTLSVAEPINSLYTYNAHFTLNNLSGTRSIKVYLQQSNVTSGTADWVSIDSITASGSTVATYIADGTDFLGRRCRFIVDGTGTQSTRYTLSYCFKKKN